MKAKETKTTAKTTNTKVAAKAKTTNTIAKSPVKSNKAEIKRIQKKIELNEWMQKVLHNEKNDLADKINLLSDYRESIEKTKEGRKKVEQLVGRVYWKEVFKDDGSGEKIIVERSRVCRVNGKPCNQFGVPFEYYDLSKKLKY